MVSVVSAVSLQTSVLRQGSQNASARAPVETSPSPNNGFVSSHIRVDNLQDVAILEYRSSRTGEVVQQYPTQSQIEAFKSAQRLHAETTQRRSEETASPEGEATQHVNVTVSAPVSSGSGGDNSGGAAPEPAPEGSGGHSTTSILA